MRMKVHNGAGGAFPIRKIGWAEVAMIDFSLGLLRGRAIVFFLWLQYPVHCDTLLAAIVCQNVVDA